MFIYYIIVCLYNQRHKLVGIMRGEEQNKSIKYPYMYKYHLLPRSHRIQTYYQILFGEASSYLAPGDLRLCV